jgi:hypothetical protein
MYIQATVHPLPFSLCPWSLLYYRYSEKQTSLALLPTPSEPTLFQIFISAFNPRSILYSILGTPLALLPTALEPPLFSVHPLPCCLNPRNLLYCCPGSRCIPCHAAYTPRNRNTLYSRHTPCSAVYTPGTYLSRYNPLSCCLHPRTYSVLGTPLVLLTSTPWNLLCSLYNPCPAAYTSGTYSVPGTTPCPAAYTPGTYMYCPRYNPLSCCLHPRNLHVLSPVQPLVLLPTPPEPTLFPVQPLVLLPTPSKPTLFSVHSLSSFLLPRNLLCYRYNPCPASYTPGTYSVPGTPYVLCLHPRNLLYLT